VRNIAIRLIPDRALVRAFTRQVGDPNRELGPAVVSMRERQEAQEVLRSMNSVPSM
jgi:hypothetical protein